VKILLTAKGDFATMFVKYHQADIISLRHIATSEWASILPHYDIVIHNGANIIPADIMQATTDNFILTKKIIDTLYIVKPTIKFIYLGSMSYLADSEKYLALEKMTPYAFSKYITELYCLKHALEDVKIVRFSTLFYENPKKDGISKLISDGITQRKIILLDNGRASRDILPLSIAIQYVLKIKDIQTLPTHKIFTIATGIKTSFAEIAAILNKKLKDLVIYNLTTAKSNDVLDTFGTTDIDLLGKIDFNINQYIENYIDNLYDENSHF
jgi:nucleoside-diphosphate-sugar epimerase